MTEDSGGPVRSSGAGLALQSYSEFWQGGRPLNLLIGQPLDVGYPWGVGIALGETAPSGGELCPGGTFVLRDLLPSFPAKEESCGAPSRGS